MAITINTPVIHKSYASVLSRIDPNALIFDNPNQQGTKLPAWFIVHREPVSSTCAIDGYQWVVYAIDIYYMVEYNKPRLFDEYAAIADQLDLELEYLPIYGTDGELVHVFDRSWELAMNALKYSTTLRLRVHPSVQREPYMQVIENLEVFIKSKLPLLKVYFTNTTHPELDIEIPERMFAYYGTGITLPTITGVYRDSEGKRWEPLAWDIGTFGETTQPLYANTTANLVIGEVIGIDTPMGGTVGIGENYGTDTIMRLTSLSMVKTPDYRYSLVASNFEPIGSGCDISLDHAPNYDYAGTLSLFVPLGCGVVEPWTPPVTEIEAYFTNQGEAGKNTTVNASMTTLNVYDASGNKIPYDTTKTYTIISAKGTYLNNSTIQDWPSVLITNTSVINQNGFLCTYCGISSYGGFNVYISEVVYKES